MKIGLILSLLILAGLTAAPAQTPAAESSSRSQFGIFGNFSLNQHSADFQQLAADIPNCCPKFRSGDGSGVSLGLLYARPLADDLSLVFRLAYASLGGTLSEDEATTVWNPSTNSSVNGNFEHIVEAQLASIGLEPLLSFELIPALKLLGGIRLAYVLESSFDQREEITQPSFGTFPDTDSRIRNAFDGDIPEASSLQLAVMGGVSYDLPMNKDRSLLLAPELTYSYALSPVAENLSWNVHSLRIGLALKIAPENRSEAVNIEIPAETSPDQPVAVVEPPVATPPGPTLLADVHAVAVDAAGQELPAAVLRIEEFLSEQMKPLLNYVFFEESAAELPSRYRKLAPDAVAAFKEEELRDQGTLATYYHVLNIIGRRMLDNPSASISLVGCNADFGDEAGNSALSLARARTVRSYLHTVWGIDTARIALRQRNLPLKASSNKDADGRAENRRVEIVSSDWNILRPIVINDTIRQATPPLLRFYPQVRADAGVQTWRLTSHQRGAELFAADGDRDIPASIDWPINERLDRWPSLEGSLNYDLAVQDQGGRELSSGLKTLPVELISLRRKQQEGSGDKRIDRYSLILFDFDNAQLSSANRRISELIRERIQPGSIVTIRGFTDRKGEADYNRDLSERRAQTLARELDVPAAQSRGLGEEILLYDNDLPEGRFYCRTVEILVETPFE